MEHNAHQSTDHSRLDVEQGIHILCPLCGLVFSLLIKWKWHECICPACNKPIGIPDHILKSLREMRRKAKSEARILAKADKAFIREKKRKRREQLKAEEREKATNEKLALVEKTKRDKPPNERKRDPKTGRFVSKNSGTFVSKSKKPYLDTPYTSLNNKHPNTQRTRSSSKNPDYPDNWNAITRKIRNRDGRKCCECGKSNQSLHVHHKIPVKKGGSHDSDNLITLCEDCHCKKHPGNEAYLRSNKTKSYRPRKQKIPTSIDVLLDIFIPFRQLFK